MTDETDRKAGLADDIRHFADLSLKKGIGLESLARDPADLECLFRIALFFVFSPWGVNTLPEKDFLDGLSRFLASDAGWLKAEAFETYCFMQACGAVVCVDGRVSADVPGRTSLTPASIREEWSEIERSREVKREAVRRRLTERNRSLHSAKALPEDPVQDAELMGAAIAEARNTMRHGEVPVGAVLAVNGVIIARSGNEVIERHDPTAHAEMLVIRRAAALLGNERLNGATLYVTLEPCAMCAAAAAHARIRRVVWGADDPRSGAMTSILNVPEAASMNHRPAMKGGVSREACGELLRTFFAERRQR